MVIDMPLPPVPMDVRCVVVASAYYQLPPETLVLIRMLEGGASGTRSKNANGSVDHGHNQINTLNLKKFEKFGITKNDITNNECVNTAAAAYLLREHLNARSGDVWKAIGDYHSKTPQFRSIYLKKAYRHYDRLFKHHAAFVAWLRSATAAMMLRFAAETGEPRRPGPACDIRGGGSQSCGSASTGGH